MASALRRERSHPQPQAVFFYHAVTLRALRFQALGTKKMCKTYSERNDREINVKTIDYVAVADF